MASGFIIHIIMDDVKDSRQNKSLWRWVLLGIAVTLTITWLALTPKGLLGKADAVGYAVCHQIEARAFHIGERPFPLCARCTGLFIGAMLALIYQCVQGRKGRMPPTPVMILLGVMAFGWIFDGANSFSMLMPMLPSLYETQNWTRLVTGTGMGLAVSAFLLPSFVQTMFTCWQAKSPLGNWKQVGGLILAAALLDGLILLEVPWILYPLALLGAAGVLILLTMVYSMVWVMIFNRDNNYERFSEMTIPLLAGYITALLQIGVIDLVRYLWMGTWGGFVL